MSFDSFSTRATLEVNGVISITQVGTNGGVIINGNQDILGLVTINSSTTGYTGQQYINDTNQVYSTGIGGSAESFFGVANKFFIGDSTKQIMRMVIDTNGRMGVSTTNPNAALDVNGTISASTVTVSGNVSAATVTVAQDSTACSAAMIGTLRRNPTTSRLEVCE